MTSEKLISLPAREVPICPVSPELLKTMHDDGVRLSASTDPVLFRWGIHLLEDWRSLELIAERYR